MCEEDDQGQDNPPPEPPADRVVTQGARPVNTLPSASPDIQSAPRAPANRVFTKADEKK